MRGRLRRLVAAALVAAALAGCTSVHNDLETRDSLCFAALPQARSAIGQAPRFAGVRFVDPAVLRSALESATRTTVTLPPDLAAASGRGACLVGYRGRFSPKVAARAWRPETGPLVFGIVVLRQSDDRVLAVVLLSAPPLRFSHLS